MSGLAGYVFIEELESDSQLLQNAGTHFSGPNYDIKTYSERDFGIVVSSRFKEAGLSGSFGEIFENNRYVLACEGYIVNLCDIGEESAQTAFQSRGETLMELYLRRGRDIFPRLNGGYNLVIWDKSIKRCTINTSKFGQRALYVIKVKGGWIFSSEAKAFRYFLNRPLSLDYETLWMTFMYGGVYGSRTLFKGIRKLLPGTSLIVTKDSSREFKARDIPRQVPGKETYNKKEHYIEQLDALMGKSVTRLMGVTKSQAVMMGSGVDSSLVAAYVKKVAGESTAVTQAMPGDWNESDIAAYIARSLECRHHVVPYHLDDAGLIKDIEAFVEATEEPVFWNQLGPPLIHLLSSITGVADSFLTGAEADLLLSYRTKTARSLGQMIHHGLLWVVIIHLIKKRLPRILPKPEHIGQTEADTNSLDRALMKKLIMVDCRGAGNNTYPFTRYYSHLPPGRNPQKHFLNHGWQNVRIISQVAQYFGKEALFPYLDDDVVSLLLTLPGEFKVNKFLLRVLLERFVPRNLVSLQKRGYWSNTIRWYYEASLLGCALDLLSEERSLNRGIYNKSELQRLIGAYRRKEVTPIWHRILWQLLLFEVFCRRFVDIH